MSQALERIRQVARQRKKERFTSLFHHLSVELLRLAFFVLKRDAAPGVDGLRWQDYEVDLDRKRRSSRKLRRRCDSVNNASGLRCSRGSYRRHATKELDGNKGDPSGSSASL